MGWGTGSDIIERLRGGGGSGDNPFANLDEDQIELLRQINLIAEQFGLSAEAAAALLTASAGGILSETQAGKLLLGESAAGTAGGASDALGYAQLAETQRQNAYERVSDRLRLLMATDQLQDARRENAMSALLQAAPLLVNPGTEFAPGFEPGGPAMQLSNLIGANVTPTRLPTANLPIGDFANAPPAVTPETINRDLAAIMGG